jgi:hypothetical protein
VSAYKLSVLLSVPVEYISLCIKRTLRLLYSRKFHCVNVIEQFLVLCSRVGLCVAVVLCNSSVAEAIHKFQLRRTKQLLLSQEKKPTGMIKLCVFMCA